MTVYLVVLLWLALNRLKHSLGLESLIRRLEVAELEADCFALEDPERASPETRHGNAGPTPAAHEPLHIECFSEWNRRQRSLGRLFQNGSPLGPALAAKPQTRTLKLTPRLLDLATQDVLRHFGGSFFVASAQTLVRRALAEVFDLARVFEFATSLEAFSRRRGRLHFQAGLWEDGAGQGSPGYRAAFRRRLEAKYRRFRLFSARVLSEEDFEALRRLVRGSRGFAETKKVFERHAMFFVGVAAMNSFLSGQFHKKAIALAGVDFAFRRLLELRAPFFAQLLNAHPRELPPFFARALLHLRKLRKWVPG